MWFPFKVVVIIVVMDGEELHDLLVHDDLAWFTVLQIIEKSRQTFWNVGSIVLDVESVLQFQKLFGFGDSTPWKLAFDEFDQTVSDTVEVVPYSMLFVFVDARRDVARGSTKTGIATKTTKIALFVEVTAGKTKPVKLRYRNPLT